MATGDNAVAGNQAPLVIAATTDARFMRLRLAGTEWGEWMSFVQAISLPLPAVPGMLGVELEVQDGAGNVSPPSSVWFEHLPWTNLLPLVQGGQ